jgi:hypothetical protein
MGYWEEQTGKFRNVGIDLPIDPLEYCKNKFWLFKRLQKNNRSFGTDGSALGMTSHPFPTKDK